MDIFKCNTNNLVNNFSLIIHGKYVNKIARLIYIIVQRRFAICVKFNSYLTIRIQILTYEKCYSQNNYQFSNFTVNTVIVFDMHMYVR